MCGPHQDGLIAQALALLGRLEHRINHESSFRRGIVAAHQARSRSAKPVRVQHETLAAAFGSDGVGQVEKSLSRTEIVFEPHDASVRKYRGEVDDVLCVSAAKTVDGLRVVAYYGEPTTGRPQHRDDVDLYLVYVLVFVNENVIPAPGNERTEYRVGEHGAP